MSFVDTGVWFACFVPSDSDHVAAMAWLARNGGPLLTTDFVVDETLTLLRARGEHALSLRASREFFAGELTAVHFLGESEIRAATDVFRQYADKAWSFTDCTSKLVIERLGLRTSFAFDHHFRQFGTVAVVP